MLTGMIAAGIPMSVFATEQSKDKEDITTNYSINLNDVESYQEVEESSEENFLNSLAEKKGISYDEAKKLNNEKLAEVGINPRARIATETVRYKTVKTYFELSSDVKLVIAAEVEYLYSNTDHEAISILDCGNPYVGIKGATFKQWSGSDPNVTVTSSKIRISATGQVYFSVQHSVAQGMDLEIFNVSSETTTATTYYSDIDTYSTNIKLSNL